MKKPTVLIALPVLMGLGLTANAEVITPTDAEIVGIVNTANTGEVQAAQIAAQKATHAEVRQFAEQMRSEHTKMNQEALDLARKLNLRQEDSATSKMLRRKSNGDVNELKKLQGAELDEEYIEDQVAMHRLVLETIEHVLIPSADNAELKALLQKARTSVASHLEHAKKLDDKYDE